MTFGEKLLNLRKEKGFSREVLADKLNVSSQDILKWELDETKPDTQNVIEIAELFDCSIDYLLKDNVEKSEAQQEVIQIEIKVEDNEKKNRKVRTLYTLSSAFLGISVLIYFAFAILMLIDELMVNTEVVILFIGIFFTATGGVPFIVGVICQIVARKISHQKMPMLTLIINSILMFISIQFICLAIIFLCT